MVNNTKITRQRGILLRMKYPLIILVAALIFFHRLIFSPGELLYPMEDSVPLIFFFENLVRASIQATGQFPWWNPQIFGGTPFVGNSAVPIFYPLDALMLLLPAHTFTSIIVIFHTFIAGLFTYLFARKISLPKPVALMSGLAFMFSSVILGKIYPGHIQNLAVISFVPVLFFLLERLMQKPSFFNSVVFGLAWALQLLAGHLQFFYFSSLFVMLYFAYRCVESYLSSRSLPDVARNVMLVALSGIIMLALSAAFLLPAVDVSTRTIRQSGIDYNLAVAFSLPPYQLVSFLVPLFFGSVVDKTYWGAWWNPWSLQAYTGIIPLMLAAIAVIYLIRKNSKVLFFSVLAAVSVLFSMGNYTPLHKLIYYLVPGMTYFRIPAEQLFIFSFSIAILAGFGTNALVSGLKDLNKEKLARFTKALLVLSIICVVLASLIPIFKPAILSYGSGLAKQRYDTLHPGEAEFESHYLPMLSTVFGYIARGSLLFSLFFFGGSLMVFLLVHKRLKRGLFLALMIILIVADLWIYSLPELDVTATGTYYPADSEAVFTFFDKPTYEYRVLDLGHYLKQHMLPIYGIQSVTGYDPTIMSDYVALANLVDHTSGTPLMTNLNLEFASPSDIANWGILDLLSTRYILSREPINRSELTLIYYNSSFISEQEIDKYKWESKQRLPIYVYTNENALPKAYIVHDYRVIPGLSAQLGAINKSDFEPLSEVIIDHLPENFIPAGNGASGTELLDKVSIIDYSANSISLVARTDGGFLVLSEMYYPGWKAYDGDDELEILRADYMFRALYLSPGEHKVRFVYEPPYLKIGAAISLAACFGIAVFLAASIVIRLIRDSHNGG